MLRFEGVVFRFGTAMVFLEILNTSPRAPRLVPVRERRRAPIPNCGAVATRLSGCHGTNTTNGNEIMQIILPITLTAAAAAAIINLWLAYRCGQVRTAQKIMMGDGGNEAMIAAMRAHSNFVEYTPFFLLLLGAIELALGSPFWLWTVSGLFLVGRVLHGLGMTSTVKFGREIGIVVTMLTLLGLAVVAIAVPYLAPASTLSAT
jgi:uncharacterized protein